MKKYGVVKILLTLHIPPCDHNNNPLPSPPLVMRACCVLCAAHPCCFVRLTCICAKKLANHGKVRITGKVFSRQNNLLHSILLEGNLPKPGNPYCGPTNQPTNNQQTTNRLTAEELKYSRIMARWLWCPINNLLEVGQNLAPFGGKLIGPTVEALLTKVLNWLAIVNIANCCFLRCRRCVHSIITRRNSAENHTLSGQRWEFDALSAGAESIHTLSVRWEHHTLSAAHWECDTLSTARWRNLQTLRRDVLMMRCALK